MSANRYGPRLAGLAVVTLAVVISGCLSAKVNDFVRYDEETDAFQILKIYTHIAGNNAPEREYVAHLWRNRNHVVAHPEVIPLFSNEPAVLRMGDHEYRKISLGEPEKNVATTQKNSR